MDGWEKGLIGWALGLLTALGIALAGGWPGDWERRPPGAVVAETVWIAPGCPEPPRTTLDMRNPRHAAGGSPSAPMRRRLK